MSACVRKAAPHGFVFQSMFLISQLPAKLKRRTGMWSGKKIWFSYWTNILVQQVFHAKGDCWGIALKMWSIIFMKGHRWKKIFHKLYKSIMWFMISYHIISKAPILSKVLSCLHWRGCYSGHCYREKRQWTEKESTEHGNEISLTKISQ